MSKASELIEKYGLDERGGDVTKEQMDSIDFKALATEIGKVLGVTPKLKVELAYHSRIGNYVKVSSEDLKSKAGLMGKLYASLVIDSDGGTIIGEGAGDFAISIGLHWEYKSLGSNGHNVLTGWWDFTKNKWTVRVG